MISVIVYGRNDTHGYNPHRRAALSLNCIAEVLSGPDDEIVFVDYNTPDELPTLPESFADTLTGRCLSLLRVIRVPAALHAERFGEVTHLPIVEPVARNVAVRRSNPSNRWLLSTTTDMIIVPAVGHSLTDICVSLKDDVYGLPRFELPEWLWEQLPRTDPATTLEELRRLGPALALDEPTVSHEWIRFDAPGDFQLVLRDDLFALDGFDERMLLGWHVDSNLSRRLHRHGRSIESLEESVSGFHCNHSRTPTVYHDTELANDLDRFVYEVDNPDVPSQHLSWGLREVPLEEIDVRDRTSPRFADAVEQALTGSAARARFDAREAKFALEYDSAHILPFVADSLRVSPRDTQVGYVGANSLLEGMLTSLVSTLEFDETLLVADTTDRSSIEEFDRRSDIFVIDLGVDVSLLDRPLTTPDPELRELRGKLVQAFGTLKRLVELERSRLAGGRYPRRFVLVNSSAAYWNAYVLSELNCGATTPHARVRRAFVKPEPDDPKAARAASIRATQLLRWIARRDLPEQRLRIRQGQRILVADLEGYPGFGRGWAFPERTAVWTQGARSELALELEDVGAGSWLVFGLDDIGVDGDERFQVELFAGDEWLDTAEFGRLPPPKIRPMRQIARTVGLTRVGSARWFYLRLLTARRKLGAFARRVASHPEAPKLTWRVRLPARALRAGKVDLTLVVREPIEWSDSRRFGLHLTSIGIEHDRFVARVPGLRHAPFARTP